MVSLQSDDMREQLETMSNDLEMIFDIVDAIRRGQPVLAVTSESSEDEVRVLQNSPVWARQRTYKKLYVLGHL